MQLAPETVKSYRKRISKKLESKNIAHSVGIALRQDWI